MPIYIVLVLLHNSESINQMTVFDLIEFLMFDI